MIVTGCQRSGTMTAAKIFGLRHEEVFGIRSICEADGKEDKKIVVPTFENVAAFISQGELRESSWLARPFISILTNKAIPIIHLIRHPLSVINSLYIGQFWVLKLLAYDVHRDFIEEHLPGIKNIEGSINKSVYYYIYWNRPLENFPRIQIEYIQKCPIHNDRPIKSSGPKLTMQTLEKETDSALYSKLSELMVEYNYA